LEINRMEHISESTLITFPAGHTHGTSTVLGMVLLDGDGVSSVRKALVVRETPFHPLDHQWPDQPGDTGIIESAGHVLQVVDSLVGAVADGSEEVFAGSSIPVRRGEPGWHWLVLHELADNSPDLPEGSPAVMSVEQTRRRQLSAAHTACHLSGVALNATLKDSWRKNVPSDSLGNPDFDSLALTQSRICTDGFHDTYRIGRTLRKQGFDRDCLATMIETVGADITARIRGWLDVGGQIRLLVAGPRFSDMRTWECDLPQGTARLACGGTHPSSLGALSDVIITADLTSDGTELQVTAKVSGEVERG
jgi:alanyl-tRNA synthetase